MVDHGELRIDTYQLGLGSGARQPLWRGPAVEKKPPFFNARALITREIMRSRDAQCNTGE